jgi:hypothetical protein
LPRIPQAEEPATRQAYTSGLRVAM